MGIAGAGLAAKAFLDKKKKEAKEKKQNKKMGGGMMKRYSTGGGADMGSSRMKAKAVTEKIKEAIQRKKRIRALQGYTSKDPMPKKMGGGMMQLPTGYNKGGGADSGTAGKTKKGAGPLGGAKGKKAQKGPRPGGRPTGRPRPSAGPMGAPPKEDKGFELKYPGPARPGNPVVAYSVNKGSMIKARGGGIAKTKPTKMY